MNKHILSTTTNFIIFYVLLNFIVLLVPSPPATCFGHTDHPQALNTLYLKLKIKAYILIYGVSRFARGWSV